MAHRANGTFGMGRRDREGLLESMRDTRDFFSSRSRRDPASRSKRSTMENAVDLAEILGGAGLVALIAGRMATPNIGNTGIPLGPVLGALAYGATMLDVFPESWDSHVQNVAIGAFVGWGALWAAEQGVRMRERAQQAPAAVGRDPRSFATMQGHPYANMGAAPQYTQQPQFGMIGMGGVPTSFGGCGPAHAPVARPTSLNEAELQTIMLRRAA